MTTMTPTPPLMMTEAEEQRKKIHNHICTRYLALKNQYPDASDNRIFLTIASECKCTSQNVRNVLVNNGLYIPKNRL